MEEWKSYKLCELCDIHRGSSPRPIQKYLSNAGQPWVKISDATSDDSRYITGTKEYIIPDGIRHSVIVKPGTLIVSNSATPGLPKIMKIEACVHDGWLIIDKVKPQVLKEFLYYTFVLIRKELSNQANGSVFQNLKTDIVKNFEIKVPSIQIQQKIVSILGTIEDKLEINNSINHNLEEQAKALYKSWFVDFEPFKDEKFKDTEIGVIPENWHTGKLSELIEICYGKDHKKLHDGSIPVYGSGGLMRFVDKSIYDKESVLIPRKGTLNNVMYVDKPFWTVDTMFYSKSKVDNIIKYCHQYLLTQDLASMNAGSAVPSMTTDILNNLIVIIPPSQIMATFDCIASSMYDEISQRNEESLALTKTRDSLLPQLMTGRYIGY